MFYIHSVTFFVICRYTGYCESGGISFYYTLFSNSKTSCFTLIMLGYPIKRYMFTIVKQVVLL